MARQNIGIGTTANDGTGDSLRDAFDKCNDNFIELYAGKIPNTTPASAAAAGTAGTIAYDSGYIYICVASGDWKRVAIATW